MATVIGNTNTLAKGLDRREKIIECVADYIYGSDVSPLDLGEAVTDIDNDDASAPEFVQRWASGRVAGGTEETGPLSSLFSIANIIAFWPKSSLTVDHEGVSCQNCPLSRAAVNLIGTT